jgi:hypothetical protein
MDPVPIPMCYRYSRKAGLGYVTPFHRSSNTKEFPEFHLLFTQQLVIGDLLEKPSGAENKILLSVLMPDSATELVYYNNQRSRRRRRSL